MRKAKANLNPMVQLKVTSPTFNNNSPLPSRNLNIRNLINPNPKYHILFLPRLRKMNRWTRKVAVVLTPMTMTILPRAMIPRKNQVTMGQEEKRANSKNNLNCSHHHPRGKSRSSINPMTMMIMMIPRVLRLLMIQIRMKNLSHRYLVPTRN